MFRFSIRELVLAIALVAIVAAWFMGRLTLSDALEAAPRAKTIEPSQNDAELGK